jgi:hypothetical protein
MARAFERGDRGDFRQAPGGRKVLLGCPPLFLPAQALEIDRTRAFEEDFRFRYPTEDIKSRGIQAVSPAAGKQGEFRRKKGAAFRRGLFLPAALRLFQAFEPVFGDGAAGAFPISGEVLERGALGDFPLLVSPVRVINVSAGAGSLTLKLVFVFAHSQDPPASASP